MFEEEREEGEASCMRKRGRTEEEEEASCLRKRGRRRRHRV